MDCIRAWDHKESDTTERLSLIQFMVPQPTLESTGRLLSGGLVARAWSLLSQGSQAWAPEESGADTAPAQLRCGLLAGTPGPGLRFTLFDPLLQLSLAAGLASSPVWPSVHFAEG